MLEHRLTNYSRRRSSTAGGIGRSPCLARRSARDTFTSVNLSLRMAQVPTSKRESQESAADSQASDPSSWIRSRMRRSRQPSTPPAIQESSVGDVFFANQRRTVSTPLEANFLNGGMPSTLAVSVADAALQVSHTPLASPSMQRRASIAGTPSPLRQPLIVRRASVQLARGSPRSKDAASPTLQRPGTFARSGLASVGLSAGRPMRRGSDAITYGWIG